MRRVNLVLLASLQQLCSARQPGFSIHEDLLAHPQFDVVFSESYISESDALALLGSKLASNTHAPDASQTDLTSKVRESAAAGATPPEHGASDGLPEIGETYEILSSPPSRYLCSIPTIAPPPELNRTATELAKAEEARELSRASERGWELLNELQGTCLYYGSGWWSYSFCYDKEIVQFHAQATGVQGGKPVKEPKTPEYVLGRTKALPKPQKQQGSNVAENQAGDESKSVAPQNTELQVKGDQRYLVQRLDGGTVCDLTGRPRTIEIQYHCNPNIKDAQISWIKEVTTCAYLMVVHTERLCDDVAFLPPKETRAHPISCRTIISNDDELSAWKWQKTADAKQSMGIAGGQKLKVAGKDASKQHPLAGMTIGGVVFGGKRVMGASGENQEPVELKPPRGTLSSKPGGTAAVAFEKLIANAKNSGVGTLSLDDLEEMGLDKETVNAVRQELQRAGAENGWEFAIEMIPGSEDELDENGAAGQTEAAAGNDAGRGGTGQDEEEEGSQETFFKEEL